MAEIRHEDDGVVLRLWSTEESALNAHKDSAIKVIPLGPGYLLAASDRENTRYIDRVGDLPVEWNPKKDFLQ